MTSTIIQKEAQKDKDVTTAPNSNSKPRSKARSRALVNNDMISQVQALKDRGITCKDICKQLHISERTYYKCTRIWRDSKGNLQRLQLLSDNQLADLTRSKAELILNHIDINSLDKAKVQDLVRSFVELTKLHRLISGQSTSNVMSIHTIVKELRPFDDTQGGDTGDTVEDGD